MNSKHGFQKNLLGFLLLILISVAPFFSKAQNLRTTDMVLYGKKVQIASTVTVLKGAVGARSLILTTGGVTFGSGLDSAVRSSLYSDSAIVLNNGNVVNGVVKANNSTITTGLPINIGSSATLKDSVVGKGSITIKAGTVKRVFLPTGSAFTYSGPTPTFGPVDRVSINSLKLPVMPPMPTTIAISSVGTVNITKDTVITPGKFGDITLSGGKSVTLSGSGTYIFKSIKNAGTTNNTFVFDFKDVLGNFIILVQGDVNLSKNSFSIVHGGGARYIFLETLGTGSTSNGNAFNLDPGSSGDSKWVGTVWAPNGNINLGTGTKSVSFTGAAFTNNTINISSNTTIDYAPYIDVQNGNNPLIVPSFEPQPTGKVDNVIGPQLQSLFDNWDGTATYEDSVFRVINSDVLIDIIVIKGQYTTLFNLLQTSPYGMHDFVSNGNQDIITGFYPIVNLDKLNALGAYISYCRPVFPPKKNNGVTTTNGDIAQRSNVIRNGYLTYGENVTVGVLSDSYNNQGLAGSDVVNDDLPGAGNATNPDAVNVLQDYPFTIFNRARTKGAPCYRSCMMLHLNQNLLSEQALFQKVILHSE